MGRQRILLGGLAAFGAAFLAGRAGAQIAPGAVDLGRRLPGVGGVQLQLPQIVSVANAQPLCGGGVATGRSTVIAGQNLGASADGRRVRIAQAGRPDVFPPIDRWSANQIVITLAPGPVGSVEVGLADASGVGWVSNTVRVVVGPPDSDMDGDGHRGQSFGGDDCDDCDVNRFPGNPEVCDARGHDEDCDLSTPGSRDTDRDRFVDAACTNLADGRVRSAGNDCNDSQGSVHPNMIDPCNGIDDDCDGEIDESGGRYILYRDQDGDGFGAPSASRAACSPVAGYSARAGDCNDANRSLFPGQGCPTGCP